MEPETVEDILIARIEAAKRSLGASYTPADERKIIQDVADENGISYLHACIELDGE